MCFNVGMEHSTLTVEDIEEEIDTEWNAGYEHAMLDTTSDNVIDRRDITHLGERNPQAWEDMTPAYRAGYDEGFQDGF